MKSVSSGFYEDLERGAPSKASSDRAAGLVFTTVFGIVALQPLVRGGSPRWWSAAIALGFLVVAVLAPQWLAGLNRAWTWVGAQLHRVVSPVILGLLFGAIIVVGRLMGRRSREALGLRFDPDRRSYWVTRDPPGPGAQTMRNQF